MKRSRFELLSKIDARESWMDFEEATYQFRDTKTGKLLTAIGIDEDSALSRLLFLEEERIKALKLEQVSKQYSAALRIGGRKQNPFKGIPND